MCKENKQTDEALVRLSREGDKGAAEELLCRYKNKVLSLAHKYHLAGGDREDLVQEGMCGLYSAMITFAEDGTFAVYAYTCIRNRMVDAVKKSRNGKNSALNGSMRISDGDGEIVSSLLSPEDALISSEDDGELKAILKGALSPLEYRAICMYIDGATMGEISLALNKTYKQTDNAIARAKHKLKDILNK